MAKATTTRRGGESGPNWGARIAIATAALGVTGAAVSQFDTIIGWFAGSSSKADASPGPAPVPPPPIVVVTPTQPVQAPAAPKPPRLTRPVPIDIDTSVVNPDDAWYVEPPKLELSVSADDPLPASSITAFLGRREGPVGPPLLASVPNALLTFPTSGPARQIIATLDTAAAIRTRYPRTPHGWYRVAYAAQPSQPDDDTAFDFNYVYRARFRGDDPRWRPNAPGVFRETNDEAAVEIVHRSPGGGYSSADLLQAFRFTGSFEVSGWFTAESTDPRHPVSLEIAFLDRRTGGASSIVLADGSEDAFTIKSKDDEPSFREAPDSALVMDGETENYFVIRFEGDQRSALCRLFIGSKRPDASTRPAHIAEVDPWLLESSPDRITLRVRRAGTIRLYDFEVAQLQR